MLPSLTGGVAGVGSGLGTAHGSIVIDTSSAQQASKEMSVIGQAIARSMAPASERLAELRQRVEAVATANASAQASGRTFGQALQQGIAGGARVALQSVRDLSAGINSLNRELAVIGAGAGLLTRFGLGSARDLRAYRIAYETLLGSQREGDRIMKQLTASANEFGLEMESVLALGRALLPALGDNADQTGEWVVRAARLRAVLPTAQQGAELRAITEYIADQTISLQRLFNIPPEIIQEAKRQFDDTGDQLDFILDKMGATEEAARRMADPVVSLKNELKLIAAIGFSPLLEDVRELATDFREWLEGLRESNPEILKIGANAVAAVGVAAPLLVFLNQVLGALMKIKSIGPLLALGKLGLVAGGAALLAREGVRRIGPAIGNEEQADIGFREMVFSAFAAWQQLTAGSAVLLARGVKMWVDGIAEMVGAMGRFLQAVGRLTPGRVGSTLEERGQQLIDRGAEIRANSDERFSNAVDKMTEDMNDVIERFGRWIGFLDSGPTTRMTDTARGQTGAEGAGGGRLRQIFETAFNDAVPGGLVEWTRFWGEMLRIQQETEAEILAATEEAARQRADIIAAYELNIARDAEDFARQRARAEEDFQRQIDEINEDRIEREAEWQEELNERIADIQADAAQQRQHMEEEHQDNLLSAASRLDARAVAEEQRRYNRQRARFEEDLSERIQNEREAHQERIAQAREADEERLADMREFHERRKAQEDEDRAIRLQRQQEDHERQLAQFDDAQARRMQQIRDQAMQERVAAAEAYRERLREQGVFYTSMITEQARQQGDILTIWGQFWRDMENGMGSGRGGRTGNETGRGGDGRTGDGGRAPSRQQLEQQGIELMQSRNWPPRSIYNQTRSWRSMSDAELARWLERTFGIDVPGYLRGTPFVPQSGLAMLHRGEMVLPAGMASLMRSRLSGFSPAAVQQATGGGGVTLQLQRGAIHIEAAPGMSERDLATEFEAAFIRMVQKLKRHRA